MIMSRQRLTLIAFLSLAGFLIGGQNKTHAAAWVGTCSCSVESKDFECQGNWAFAGSSQQDLAQQCARQTAGHGRLSNVHANAEPPLADTLLPHCDKRGVTYGAPPSEIIDHATKTISGGGTDSLCAKIPKGVTATYTLCNVWDDNHKKADGTPLPGWCSFSYGTNGCGVGYMRSNSMGEVPNPDGSKTICWNVNNQSNFPRYVDFWIMK
jgi:hypothetical protein